MPGLGEERIGIRQLADRSPVHDRDSCGEVLDDRQIMGDEQVGQTTFRLSVHQQIHDLGLHRDIQGGDGLVGHEELGIHAERPGDGDTLPLPSGELVGEALAPADIDTHVGHQRIGPMVNLRMRPGGMMEANGLLEGLAHRQTRIQR